MGFRKELAKLNANDPAYIGAAHIDNTAQFMLFSGDGLKLGTALTFKSTYLAALENALGPVSLHLPAA